jgi:MFS family permease
MVSRTVRAPASRTLSQPAAYGLAAAVIGLALFASGTPSPLYVTYRELWGFSSIVLTLVYATYAFGVLASLLLAGRVSDEVGRRPVLLIALTALMGATVLFMVASSVAWLFAARAIQGLATGLALGSASAALLDLHPRRDPGAVGLTNGVVSAAGMGLGVLVSATLVEFAPAPRLLPYVVLFALFVLALTAVLRMPEPVETRARPRLTPQRPRVPAVVRRPFLLAALAVMASWSIGGLFLALGPQLAALVLHSHDHFVTGIGVFALAGSGSLAQVAFGSAQPSRGAAAGALALAMGVLLIVLAAATSSALPFVAGCVIGGAGFGVAFLGALRTLSGAIPDARRAEVMSAFYVIAYASLSLPAVLAGVLVTPLGLETTFELFGSVVAALALVVAWQAWRTRPRPAPEGCAATPRAGFEPAT